MVLSIVPDFGKPPRYQEDLWTALNCAVQSGSSINTFARTYGISGTRSAGTWRKPIDSYRCTAFSSRELLPRNKDFAPIRFACVTACCSSLRPIPSPRILWRDRHLRQLVNTIAHRNQSHAANSLIAEIAMKIAALLQDLVLGVAQRFRDRFLQGEVAGDPLFIQRPEGGRVFSHLQWPDLDLRKTRRIALARYVCASSPCISLTP